MGSVFTSMQLSAISGIKIIHIFIIADFFACLGPVFCLFISCNTCLKLCILPWLWHQVRLSGLILNQSELPMTVTRVSPNALLESYSSRDGGFNPPVQGPAAASVPMSKRAQLVCISYFASSQYSANIFKHVMVLFYFEVSCIT